MRKDDSCLTQIIKIKEHTAKKIVFLDSRVQHLKSRVRKWQVSKISCAHMKISRVHCRGFATSFRRWLRSDKKSDDRHKIVKFGHGHV